MKYRTGGKEMRVLFFKTLLALAMAGLLASPVYAADAGIRVEQAWARASIGTSRRSEEHTSELQSLMRISYAVFCLKKKNNVYRNSTFIIFIFTFILFFYISFNIY